MKDFKSANFPIDGEGRTYHVATKPGETANRILTVGDPERCLRIAEHFDTVEHKILSKRGFLTVTGIFKGERVSIIAIGMGIPVADMMMREVRAVTKGPLLVVRFGSCGGIKQGKPGSIAVAGKGAVMISKNYDYWINRYNGKSAAEDSTAAVKDPYSVSSIIPADKELSDALYKSLEKELGSEWVLNGGNATADSFYSSQGRQDISFGDDNNKVIDTVLQKFPECETLEMESGMLFHLAQASTFQSRHVADHPGPIRSAACHMIFFNRLSNASIAPDYVTVLEKKAGRAVLEALVSIEL